MCNSGICNFNNFYDRRVFSTLTADVVTRRGLCNRFLAVENETMDIAVSREVPHSLPVGRVHRVCMKSLFVMVSDVRQVRLSTASESADQTHPKVHTCQSLVSLEVIKLPRRLVSNNEVRNLWSLAKRFGPHSRTQNTP